MSVRFLEGNSFSNDSLLQLLSISSRTARCRIDAMQKLTAKTGARLVYEN